MVPLHIVYGGIVLEFELDDSTTCCQLATSDFELIDVKFLATLHTIGNALANNYVSHALRKNPLQLHYNKRRGKQTSGQRLII